jgi:hypothetical protein
MMLLVRNVFDQYEQLENRVTHALVASLGEDRSLLRSFLKEVARCRPPPRARLFVEEQRIPDEPEVSEEEAAGRGLPDAWIHDRARWSLLIESKVTAPVRPEQLRRHLATAARRGFDDARLLVVSAVPYKGEIPKRGRNVLWKDIYSWLRRHQTRSAWAVRASEFFEITEARMAEREDSFEGALTEFTGFPFGPGRPYSYGEAKRALRLALDELRQRSDLRRLLGMDSSGRGRPAITGRDAHAVWDFLPLRRARRARQHTEYPHLTLALEIDRVVAHVTLPNGMATPLRRRLRSLSRSEFEEILAKIEANLRPVVRRAPGAAPWFIGLQRHYPTQRSTPIVDARLDFDLRTLALAGKASGPVKPQPALLDIAYGALRNRRPNYQMAVGLILPYGTCTAGRSRRALDLVARTWIGCRPILDAVLRG